MIIFLIERVFIVDAPVILVFQNSTAFTVKKAFSVRWCKWTGILQTMYSNTNSSDSFQPFLMVLFLFERGCIVDFKTAFGFGMEFIICTGE